MVEHSVAELMPWILYDFHYETGSVAQQYFGVEWQNSHKAKKIGGIVATIRKSGCKAGICCAII
jgi:hypothetical protein